MCNRCPCELKMHCFVIQVITNVDIQSIEPVDQQMRDSLSKSVQMAIEISTKYATRFIYNGVC